MNKRHFLTAEQCDEIRRALVRHTGKNKLITRLDHYLALIDQVRAQGPSVDVTLLTADSPEYLQIMRMRKQAANLMQSINGLSEQTREILQHQWSMWTVGDSEAQGIDDPLAGLSTYLDALVKQAETTLAAHRKPPRRPRSYYAEAQVFAAAKAIRETWPDERLSDSGILVTIGSICIPDFTRESVRGAIRNNPQSTLGEALILNTREFRRAKH